MKKRKLPKYQVGTTDKGLAALKAASMAVSGATLSGTPAMASMAGASAIDTGVDENVQELSPGLCVNSMGQRVDCITKELINATDTNPLMQGFTMDSDGVYRKKVITDKPGSPLGYSEEFKGINAILDATQAIAGNINDFKTSRRERQDYIEAIQPDARYNQYEKGLNNVPVYMQKGGQTQNDREMLSGVADMLRRVKSSSNRKEIAKYMMDGFREEGVVFKPSNFLKSANVYKKGGNAILLDMVEMAKGGEMIRRADGSYSKRGLWDNIRANKGSGKKPTKAMLAQERKLKAKMRTGGGMVNCANCGHSWEYDDGGENPMSCHKCGGMVKKQSGGMVLPKYQFGNSKEGPLGNTGGIPIDFLLNLNLFRGNPEARADRQYERQDKRANKQLEKSIKKTAAEEQEEYDSGETMRTRAQFYQNNWKDSYNTPYRNPHQSFDPMREIEYTPYKDLYRPTLAVNYGPNNYAQTGGLINNTGYLPGTPTENNPYNIIPSNTISMQGVPRNIMAYPNNGRPMLMLANSGEYNFPESDYVLEVPAMDEESSYQEDMSEMKTGGIPDRYKNKGFTRVGAKRKSTRPGKKWMVLAKKGDKYKIVHGGDSSMQDFSQHRSKKRQKNFWNRMGTTNDPFSARYWHKKFGTWQQGGDVEEYRMPMMQVAGQPTEMMDLQSISPEMMEVLKQQQMLNLELGYEKPNFSLKGNYSAANNAGSLNEQFYGMNLRTGSEEKPKLTVGTTYQPENKEFNANMGYGFKVNPSTNIMLNGTFNSKAGQQADYEAKLALTKQLKKGKLNFNASYGTKGGRVGAEAVLQEGGQVTMDQQQTSQEELIQILQIFAEYNNMTIEELMAKLQQLPEDQMQKAIEDIIEDVQEIMMENDGEESEEEDGEENDEAEVEVEEMQTGGLKNFEERMYKNKASLKNSDGTSSTHKMMSFEVDGKYYAAPTIVEMAGELVELDENTAIDYALRNKEYKQFATEKEAFDYANNGYKKKIKMQFKEGGYLQDMPNAELEQGEVFQTQQGGITKVPESEPRHEDGGSPQANVSRVLEDTSDKRKDIDSRLLLINPDQAFRLTGFKPKKSVSHSKLYEQANESYTKQLNTFEKKIKDNMDFIKYKNGGVFAQNALNENIKMLEAMPKPIDIFDTIYAHQEEVKQRYNITNDTNQAKTGGRKLPMYQTGTSPKKGETRFDPNDQYSQQAWDGTKWVKTSEYGKPAPSAQTGTISYIKGKAKKVDKQPAGSKQVGEDAQNIYYGIPGTDSYSTVPKTTYGKKTTKTDEEYIAGLTNYSWDDLVKNKIVADTPANKTIYDKYSSEYDYSYIPKPKSMTATPPPVVVDEPVKGGTPTTTTRKYDFNKKATPSRFNEPLRWYDTMPSMLNYLSSLGRTPVDLEQLQYEPINTREESWLPQIMQTEGDFQTALRSIPMDGGTGQANIANLLAQKYSADQQAIAGVESRNKAKNDQTNAINAQGRMQMNATNLGLRDTFNNRILQGKEVQRVSKLNAFDDYATMVAQNAKLNREGNLLMQLTPYFDQFAEFNGNNYTPSQFAKDVNNGRYKVETVRSSNGQLQELIVDQTTGKSVPKSQVIK